MGIEWQLVIMSASCRLHSVREHFSFTIEPESSLQTTYDDLLPSHFTSIYCYGKAICELILKLKAEKKEELTRIIWFIWSPNLGN